MLFDSQWVTFVLVLGTIGMLVASATAAAQRSYPWFVVCWSLFTAGYGLASWTFLVQDVFGPGSGVSLADVGGVVLAVAFYMMFLVVAAGFGVGVSSYTVFWYVSVVSFVAWLVLFVVGVVALYVSALGMPG